MPADAVEIGQIEVRGLVDVPLSGNIRLQLRLGYLTKRFAPVASDPRGEYVEQQELAESNTVTVRIAGLLRDLLT